MGPNSPAPPPPIVTVSALGDPVPTAGIVLVAGINPGMFVRTPPAPPPLPASVCPAPPPATIT